jgi:hypothetical protein
VPDVGRRATNGMVLRPEPSVLQHRASSTCALQMTAAPAGIITRAESYSDDTWCIENKQGAALGRRGKHCLWRLKEAFNFRLGGTISFQITCLPGLSKLRVCWRIRFGRVQLAASTPFSLSHCI